ncbi:Cytochrome P450 714C2 [Apostasia shenzhenica]|uniref:Cytochrome P450 714C2 n=1 Tax=Apostasia shenzhenica TaxID=1088818 RepID=A0A2I0A8F6_9ASPA|nr:Cytochrome P450 714C2 [Apostasia shenzhenica]
MDFSETSTHLQVVLSSLLVGGFLILLLFLCQTLSLGPKKQRATLGRQGIRGPPPSLIYGNIPDMRRIVKESKARRSIVTGGACSAQFTSNYALSLFPYFDHWRKIYGPTFYYSTGNILILYVSLPELIKEIGLNKSFDLGKPSYLKKDHKAIFGEGIIASNGELWAHQRKIIAPEFFIDKVKGMVKLMVDAAVLLLNSWESIIARDGANAEIVVDADLKKFSANVIAKVCFGSNYSEGKDIFMHLSQLQDEISKPNIFIGIPGVRYLPTKHNRKIWRLEKEIRSLILKLAKERREISSTLPKNDLLQFILEGAESSPCSSSNFIVDNCKNIYFAGYETTAVSAAWCLMLLASHHEWQELARAEVIEVCQGHFPEASMLHKMKVLTMVIQETLRLYPPAAFLSREALRDVNLGDIHIPKGVNIKVLIPNLHHDPIIWGEDAGEFKPRRFANGISGACKLPHAYIPFGIGSRTCAGQNLAMVELKVLLSLLLSKFTFSLSPKYVHSPSFRLTIEPGFGLPLILSMVA